MALAGSLWVWLLEIGHSEDGAPTPCHDPPRVGDHATALAGLLMQAQSRHEVTLTDASLEV